MFILEYQKNNSSNSSSDAVHWFRKKGTFLDCFLKVNRMIVFFCAKGVLGLNTLRAHTDFCWRSLKWLNWLFLIISSLFEVVCTAYNIWINSFFLRSKTVIRGKRRRNRQEEKATNPVYQGIIICHYFGTFYAAPLFDFQFSWSMLERFEFPWNLVTSRS